MKYTVTIEEIINQDFEVEATSSEEALKIAKEKYDSKDFILNNAKITYVSGQATNNKDFSDRTEWVIWKK